MIFLVKFKNANAEEDSISFSNSRASQIGLYSFFKTPQQNGVVERKNRTVMEMARTMLNESKLSTMFWPQAIHTVVHILK